MVSAEQSAITAAKDGVSDRAMTGAWRVIIARKGERARTWYYHSADAHMHKAALRQQADEWFYALGASSSK